MGKTGKYIPDESIGYLIGMADRYLRRSLREKFREEGLNITGEHWHLLMYLYIHDGQKQKDLALLTGKSKEAIARVVTYLEENNLVVRVTAEDDSRSKKVFLTAEGRDYEKRINSLAKENLEAAEKGIEKGDLEIFKKCLRQVLKNIKG